jgi:hypothetical protein
MRARRNDMLKRVGFAAVVSGLAITSSLAQTSPPVQGGRFSMHPADGGMIRLDGETGTMSMCKPRNGQWQCESLPDERAALDKEITRLAKENQDLQGAVKRLEELAGIPSDKPKSKSGGAMSQLPGPEDVDKAMSYLQGMLKKFKEKIREFEDLEGGSGKKSERL